MRLFRIHPVVLMLCAGLAACQDGGGYGQPQASSDPVYQIYPNPDDPDSVPVYVPQSQLNAYYNGQGAQPASGGYDDSQQAAQQEMMRQQQERAQQEQQRWFEQNYGAPGQ
jgi:hypothetical protein